MSDTPEHRRLPASQLHPLDAYHDEGKASTRRLIKNLVSKPVLKTVLRTHVAGQENVADVSGAYIAVGNHSSHLDAPMVFSLLPDHMTARLATGAAADYWYRRKGIAKLTSLFLNTYPIERKGKYHGPDAGKAAGMTGRLLHDGIPILIFPEGTRSRNGEMGAFKAGSAALSIKFDVPIIPLALEGGHDAMPVGNVLPNLGRPEVGMYIGKPMKAREGELPEEFIERVRDQIILMLEQRTAFPKNKSGESDAQ